MYISSTNSTNTLMKELLAKGEWREGERFLYTAFQTAGRGQAGNGWESEEGKNLLCSILLPPNKNLYFLNIAIGVASVCTLSGSGFLYSLSNGRTTSIGGQESSRYIDRECHHRQ